MRLRFQFLALLLFSAIGASAATFFVSTPAGNRFDPLTLTIDQGDTVIWTNRTSTLHDTVSDTGVWRSPLFGFRGSYSFTFNVPGGSYGYYCTPHVGVGMVGTIIVRGPPNAAPTVTITSPANNTSFGANDPITVTANATDDGTISRVQLLVNGVVTRTDSTPPYTFSLTLGAGTYTLVARGTDTLNAQGNSDPITITVRGPNQAPAVTLTSPADSGPYTAPAELNLAANGTDDVQVTRVEFLVNDIVVGDDTTEPFTFARTFAAGDYTIAARAYDAGGLNTTSASRAIQVRDPIPEFPTVVIHMPTEGEYVYLAQTIMFRADARDLDGTIASVVFKEGETILGTATAPAVGSMYHLDAPLTEGVHTITATATDNAGKATTSNPVTFTVVLPPEFTPPLILESGAARVGVFGTSGVPFVFQRSIDGGQTWTSFLTNSLVRRIRFFDDELGGQNVMYRAISPEPPVAPAAGHNH